MPFRLRVYLVWITFIEYSHWSKDIVFVISDSHLDGMHAWLTAYHEPSNTGASSELFKVSFLMAV
jgi:Gaa1-like, GPI transamidase component